MTDAVNTDVVQMPDLSLAAFCSCGQHHNQTAGPVDAAQSIENDVWAHQPDDRVVPTTESYASAHEPDGVIDYGATPATSVGTSGNADVDSLIRGLKWVDTDLTYSFTDSFSGDYPSNYPVNSTNFTQATAGQQAGFVYWFDEVDKVSSLTFAELDGADGALDEDQEATIKIARDTDLGTTAFAYYPSSSHVGGDIWLDNTATDPTLGTYSHHQLGHELGHAIGLKHGHETSPNGATSAAFDSIEYSIMTYRSYPGHDLTTYPYYTSQGYSQTLMMFDIAAIQHSYGANFNTNSGDTTYTFDTTTGEMSIDGVGQGAAFYNEVFRTLWDGDGVDTYDLSNYTTDLLLDLTPGEYSDFDVGGNFQRTDLGYFGPGPGTEMARGHLFNAMQYMGDARSLIENAIGGSGNDSLLGNDTNNALTGNDGDDTLDGGAGRDTLDGGAGNDSINGGSGSDSIDAGIDDDVVDAGAGHDTIFGDTGNDSIDAGSGDDTVDGWTGDDTLDGGYGIDTADYSAFGSGLTVNLLNTGAQFVSAAAGTDTLTNFENLIGGLGGDNLTGNSADNVISGNIGNDFIYGQRGDDLVLGGDGFDQLRGNKGMDTLDGGAGRDVLVGGSEADTFLFSLMTDTAVGGFRDRIVDFNQGEDIIDISAFDAIAGGTDDAFTFIDMATFGTAGAGALRHFHQGVKTIIEGDVDGDNVRDFQIEMIGNFTLTAGDFVA